MNRAAISAAIGVLVAGGAMAAAYYPAAHIRLDMMMAAAAALSMGAAASIITRSALDKPGHHTLHADLGAVRLKMIPGLIDKFPTGGGTVQLSVRPDTKADNLDVVKHPAQYAAKDVVVTLRASGSSVFNPVELKRLFASLRDHQPGFVHLLLLDKHDEFVGYIPGFVAKSRFTGGEAESAIAKNIVDVFADPNNSANLKLIDGASKVDTIRDDAKISEAVEKMSGGFRTLVVLESGNHRKPVGLVSFSGLMGHTLGAQISHGEHSGAHSAHASIGAFRPTK